jgi:hypothetical protein
MLGRLTGEEIGVGWERDTRVGVSQDQSGVMVCQEATAVEKIGSSFAASLSRQNGSDDWVATASEGLLSVIRCLEQVVEDTMGLRRITGVGMTRHVSGRCVQLSRSGQDGGGPRRGWSAAEWVEGWL